ncbi:poly(A)-binding protein binding protein [Diatrype stigma]|uniref:Poly(A)-binding protein binding protein n=1 Tax=Diatrype stigma TaxID=117547 RepID=A0AAN9UZR4_9PEZI
MSFQKKDGSDTRVMAAKGDSKAPNGNAAGFRTDSAISSSRSGMERPLQRWVPDSSDTFDHTLEKSSGGASWDQFAENERLFGLKTNYDENFYTTQIDKNDPQYKQKVIIAERKAREIERSTASTAHVAEERVMDYVGGGDDKADEEDKYSGVKRQDFPPLPGGRENKYTPPARRAPTGASNVKGVPVDPAIISSQLKTQRGQTSTKVEDAKARGAGKPEAVAPLPAKIGDVKLEAKAGSQQKPMDAKASNQISVPLKPSAATSRTISPQAKETTPSAALTVERDVLKEFKSFANQQRINVEKVRSTKAKADKEVKLIELRKFADSFKLPTPVPMDLISIIAKDPAKQREIQQKAQRDAEEVKKRKTEEAAAKEKKAVATSKETQPTTTTQAPPDTRTTRPTAPATTTTANQGGAQGRHQGNRQNFVPQYPQFPNNRSSQQHMSQGGRQPGGLTARIRNNMEQQKMQPIPQSQDMRLPPTGPANSADPSFNRRMGVPGHLGGKLNPNSHEFRPSPFAASFSPNGHPSATSSPRSGINNGTEAPSTIGVSAPLVVITKKRKTVDPKKCVILSYVKTLQPPENKNWNDNDGIPPSYDTPPTWRSVADDEKPDSTMRLSYNEWFESKPFNPQPTPNPPHVMPHIAHQHQLPFHLQHGAHSMGPRHSPHVPPVQMHGAQHGPVPHVPFNGPDDHRMMHSSSSQSFSSPRMGQVPMAYAPTMNSPAQMPYNQPVMPSFMGPGQPQMNQFNRSFSNNTSYMPQQPGGMGGQMMPPQFMTPQGMVAVPPQMQMYQPGHPQFIPPGATPPQPMPGANGYPSPGRPAAPMMVHQGSQQGQPMYGMSPGMQYQQPAFSPQQQGQMNNMRGYSNPGPQQFGTSPSQMHQYGPPHRNGSNNFNKSYQGHNQHQGPQGSHPIPTGPQGRNPDGSDEAK